jgi:hypothetical protein
MTGDVDESAHVKQEYRCLTRIKYTVFETVTEMG